MLSLDLAAPQSRRIAAALAESTPRDREIIEKFLMAMVNPDSRAQIAAAPADGDKRLGRDDPSEALG
jgi:hypothetical protein